MVFRIQRIMKDQWTENSDRPVLLFDGYCNLCSRAVVFVMKRERNDVFRFASLQSSIAGHYLSASSFTSTIPDSIVLITERGVFFRSTAALMIAGRLKWPWPLMKVFFIIPRIMRDLLYDFIAKNRYRWFGKRQQCFIPQEDMSYKFLG